MQISAYAKINLVLDVLRRREDGYHEVSMVMQAIDLADRIVIEEASRNWIETNNKFIPVNNNNLAMKAVVRMQQEFTTLPPLRITLQKNIPVAAGLAGGSSDCAAVLAGINEMFQLNVSEEQLEAIGAELGSDVPFCLSGPTAWATGRGEKLKKLKDCPKLYVILVKPPFGVSTPKVYGNLKLDEAIRHPQVDRCIQGIENGRTADILESMGNVLESSTFKLEPKVEALKDSMIRLGCKNVLMSGSGPTVFALFEDQEEAKYYYEKVKERYSTAILSKTVDSETLKERMIQL